MQVDKGRKKIKAPSGMRELVSCDFLGLMFAKSWPGRP